MANRNARFTTAQICMVGVMAALVFVSNYLAIPFMDTNLRPANALCALSGLIFGPGLGFLSAGLGSFLYDIMTGYGAESLITLVSKGAIALVAGFIVGQMVRRKETTAADWVRMVVACIVGAFTYVALYMLKTYIYGMYVNGLGYEATLIKMGSKLPGSLINATFASIVAPGLFSALRVPLRALLPAEHKHSK